MLVLKRRLYTSYVQTLLRITTPRVGPVEQFIGTLQGKLNAKLANQEEWPNALATDEPLLHG
jgi:hypothetical protein